MPPPGGGEHYLEPLQQSRGGPLNWRAVNDCSISKQCFIHWIVDVIAHAYWTSNRLFSSGVKCQSTSSVATSQALVRGASGGHLC